MGIDRIVSRRQNGTSRLNGTGSRNQTTLYSLVPFLTTIAPTRTLLILRPTPRFILLIIPFEISRKSMNRSKGNVERAWCRRIPSIVVLVILVILVILFTRFSTRYSFLRFA